MTAREIFQYGTAFALVCVVLDAALAREAAIDVAYAFIDKFTTVLLLTWIAWRASLAKGGGDDG